MTNHPHWGPTDALLHGPSFSDESSIATTNRNGNGTGTIYDWSHKPSAGVPTDTVRQNYRELTGEEQFQIASVKDVGQEFLDLLDTLPMSREIALAKTKVEEAVMWATKGVTK